MGEIFYLLRLSEQDKILLHSVVEQRLGQTNMLYDLNMRPSDSDEQIIRKTIIDMLSSMTERLSKLKPQLPTGASSN